MMSMSAVTQRYPEIHNGNNSVGHLKITTRFVVDLMIRQSGAFDTVWSWIDVLDIILVSPPIP